MKNPIPTDWNGEDWCSWAICWPDSPLWRGILMGLITSPGRGRFWDEKTGLIVSAQDIGRQITEFNIPLQESIMSCTGASQLAEAMRAVAEAIRDRPCCGSGAPGTPGGVGTGGAPGTQVPATGQGDEPEDFPEGFTSYQEYKTYKCNIATFIINRFKADLEKAADINVIVGTSVSTVAGILGVTLATPIVGDELLVVAGIALLLAGSGIYQSVLTEMIEAVDNAFNDLVCALYNSSSVQNAQERVKSVFEASLEEVAVFPMTMWGNQLLPTFFSAANLNILFEKDTSRNYPAGNCENCSVESEIVITRGTVVSGTLFADGGYNEVVLQGVMQAGNSAAITIATQEFFQAGTYGKFFYFYGLEVLQESVDLLNCDGQRQDTEAYANGLHFVNSGFPMASFTVRSAAAVGTTVRVRVKLSTSNIPPV